jgi:hypothetical protein
MEICYLNVMKLNLFSVPIFIANIDIDKLKIENGSFKETWLSETISSHAEGDVIDKESSDYLLTTISKKLIAELKKPFKINLTHIWENHYKNNDFQERHTHPQSHFSFIIYKKIDKSNTVFFHPAEDLITSYYNGSGLSMFNTNFMPECREGQIIIFPSFLGHMVKKSNNSQTISGNVNLEMVK